MTEEQMNPLKFSYDVLAEECLNVLDEISPPVDASLPWNESKAKVDRDLYALIRDNASKNPKLGELWDQVNAVPEWVDWDQIARGQDVFYRYGGVALTAVTFLIHLLESLLISHPSLPINPFSAAWEQRA